MNEPEQIAYESEQIAYESEHVLKYVLFFIFGQNSSYEKAKEV